MTSRGVQMKAARVRRSIIRTKFLYRVATNELDFGHPSAAGMAVSLMQDAVEAMDYETVASVNAQLSPMKM